MFCSKCGAQIAEGLTACPACGEEVVAVAAPVVEEAPVVVESVQPEKKVRKMKYLLTKAPGGIRFAGIAVWVLTVLFIVALFGSYNAAIGNSFDEIPIVKAAGSFIPDLGDPSELTEKYEEALDEALDELGAYLESENELSAEQEKMLEELLDSAEELSDEFSIQNIDAVFGQLETIVGSESEALGDVEMGELKDAFTMAADVSLMLDIVKIALALLAAFCGIWFLFGGIFRLNGLNITGIVFLPLYVLPFCSTPYALALMAMAVAMIVFTAIASTSYSRYRRA